MDRRGRNFGLELVSPYFGLKLLDHGADVLGTIRLHDLTALLEHSEELENRLAPSSSL
jgi:hypothetical protein